MGTPFMSEIRMMSFNFPPKGWATCNGQILPIAQNQALFALLGTTYGGNGQTTFALPNLQGRTPVHWGFGEIQAVGQVGGEMAHTLTISELPAHNHLMNAVSEAANTNIPTGNLLAQASNVYASMSNLTTMSAAEVSTAGGSQPHNNMQPYSVLNFCIALQGVFPSQN